MKIAVASDHAGYRLKVVIIDYLRQKNHDILDLGTNDETPVDYPPICAAAAREVAKGNAQAGIVLGGSGQGEAIAANKVRGIRAALCMDEFTARLARSHNDANVLSMGGRIVGQGLALAIVEVFFSTPFEGGRHIPRIEQLKDIENQECENK